MTGESSRAIGVALTCGALSLAGASPSPPLSCQSSFLSTMSPKDEESPADYNNGGYLQVKPSDLFKDGRYTILRKLGYLLFPLFSLGPLNLANISQLGPLFHRLASQRLSVRYFHSLPLLLADLLS
jgi:hypothetical protein